MSPSSEEKSWGRKVDRTDWDYIVIGSGMGGMCAAALLTKLGRRVLVVEKHYVPGGFTHTFKRHDWVWDVGVHAIGEVTDDALVGRLLHRLTDRRLEWATLGPVYDAFSWNDGFEIDFPDERKQFAANLKAAFPGEEKAIDGFFGAVKEVVSGIKGYHLSRLLPHRAGRVSERLLARSARRAFAETASQRLDRLTDNARLKAVLTAQWGYHGSPPSQASWAAQALVSRHFFYGGYYPVGGSDAIARELLRTVAEGDGWTLIRHPVEELVIERGRVVGVRAKGKEYRARRAVVSAIGARATVERLLPQEHASRPWARSIAGLKPSPAHLCLYLGFKGDIREAGAGSGNRWFYRTWDHDDDHWDITSPESIERGAPILYVSFPSLKDPKHEQGPDQLHTGEVVTFVPHDQFAQWGSTRWHKRGADYDTLKKQIQDRMLEQLFENMPGLRDKLAYVELSTPLSTEHFTSATKGAIYGLAAEPARFANPWLRPRTPLPGLALAGCDVSMCGVIGAMMGGVLAATSLEPRRGIGLLRQVI